MEIGRFVYGGFKIFDQDSNLYIEPSFDLSKGDIIGNIDDTIMKKVFRPINPSTKIDLENEVWNFVSKEMITEVHAKFKFKNDNYKLSVAIPYLDCCGKYYCVKLTIYLSCLQRK